MFYSKNHGQVHSDFWLHLYFVNLTAQVWDGQDLFQSEDEEVGWLFLNSALVAPLTTHACVWSASVTSTTITGAQTIEQSTCMPNNWENSTQAQADQEAELNDCPVYQCVGWKCCADSSLSNSGTQAVHSRWDLWQAEPCYTVVAFFPLFFGK